MDKKHKADKPKPDRERQTIMAADVATVSVADLQIDEPDKPKPPQASQLSTSHGRSARVVAGVATFSGHGGIATGQRAAALEAAEVAAVHQALADGVSIEDSAAIKAYKETARRQVKLMLDRPVARD